MLAYYTEICTIYVIRWPLYSIFQYLKPKFAWFFTARCPINCHQTMPDTLNILTGNRNRNQ